MGGQDRAERSRPSPRVFEDGNLNLKMKGSKGSRVEVIKWKKTPTP
jgi:hypothetical protein